MSALVCDLCGGKLIMGPGGIAVCDSCGMEYSPERMKEKVQEIKGTVRIDNTHMISTYLDMASTALEAGNLEEAENYANKVIEIDPHSAKAWFYKGKAAGWQTTGRNNRYSESIVSWINAYNYSGTEELKSLIDDIKSESMKLAAALLKMHCNSFVSFRSQDNVNDITNALKTIKDQLDTLCEKTSIDVYDNEMKKILAGILNSCAVDASNNADKSFGPENRNRDTYSWKTYTAAKDWCLDILNTAYDLCYDDNLCHTICHNYVAIAEKTRDSCSYKFEPSAYGSGKYIPDYSFTDTAKKFRTSKIDDWKSKERNHDPNLRKSNCQDATKIYYSLCSEEGRKTAIAQYWESHADEKSKLETELADIDVQKSNLIAEEANNTDHRQLSDIDSQVAVLRAHKNSLSIFKGKEKKAIATKINELLSSKNSYEERWAEAKKLIDAKQSKLDNRRSEIVQELTKDRGAGKIVLKKLLTIFNDKKGAVSPLDLVCYYKEVLPARFTIVGDGNDAIENYSKTMAVNSHRALALIAALTGNTQDATKESQFVYTEDPDHTKTYRINFQVDGKDSRISANMQSKTIDSLITGYFYYELEGDKSAQSVANFIQLVIYSLAGFCPSFESNGLAEKISEVAYGFSPETDIKTDNLNLTISGGTKGSLKLTIMPRVN